MVEKLIILFQMKYNDPVSKQSALSPLSVNKPPNFTFLPPPICSTPWRIAKASPTCPNRTWLQIRFCPHPVLRKDQVKQLILHVNKDRCKGNRQAKSLHISRLGLSKAGVGAGKPKPILPFRATPKFKGTWLEGHTLLKRNFSKHESFSLLGLHTCFPSLC